MSRNTHTDGNKSSITEYEANLWKTELEINLDEFDEAGIIYSNKQIMQVVQICIDQIKQIG